MMIIAIYLLVVVTICSFALYRNEWVYRVRTSILYKDMEEYDSLLSNDEMFKKFWIWDIEKLKKQTK